MALAFVVPFAVFAAAGAHFVAIWHEGPVDGFDYWLRICTSPELFVFVFFMMSDPKTAARTPRGRVVYGLATALLASALVVFQTTEFGIKLAILASLTVSCALVPLLEDVAAGRSLTRGRSLSALRRPALLAVVIIAIAAPLDTLALTGDHQIPLIERGLVGKLHAQ